MLKNKMIYLINKELDISLFVGEYFKSDPAQFEFGCADRKMLTQISNHIKSVIIEEKQHFVPQKGQKINLSGTVYIPSISGYLFTKIRSSLSSSTTLYKQNGLRNEMRKHYKKYIGAEKFKHVENLLTADLTLIRDKKTFIKCLFCSFDGINTVISIFAKQSKNEAKTSFVLSNFDRHLAKKHPLNPLNIEASIE